MGAVFSVTRALESEFVMGTYARVPLEFVSGRGMELTDSAGNTYLDFVSGLGAVSIGHAHPAVTAAIEHQAHKLLHVSNLFYVEHRAELARDISDLLNSEHRNESSGGISSEPAWQSFFANSGAEANEAAIKLARRYGAEHKPMAHTILTATNSFHGRTLATLTATGQPEKNERFAPLPEGFEYVPLNDIGALEEVMGETVIAVMLECIQGEGGVNPATVEYVQAARDLCDKHGALLIIDEVQTGFFRTGKPFAFQHAGITPDIVTIAKGMGNGVPIGACCAREEVARAFQPGDHGSTFGGGPLVCAASRAVIAQLTDPEVNIAAHVLEVGAYAQGLFKSLPGVIEVRGAGLMLALEFDAPCAVDIVAAALAKGFVLNNIGTHIIRLLPPLICTKNEVHALFCVLRDIVDTRSEAE